MEYATGILLALVLYIDAVNIQLQAIVPATAGQFIEL